MAVPKQKQSKQRTRKRRSTYIALTQRKLINKIGIVTCKNCDARIPERTICPECGQYKGLVMKKIKVESEKTVVRV
ncbi:50S ribosomal protein L32 [Candidatus Peregrinibacteria bacterium]|nr:MAG: 50S ribosomal protein L32 [Candidatus Peregrinibacteria bacterium]